MPNSFLDTSALVKHYHPEVGTPQVERLWADSGVTLSISRLGVVETVSVFARKVREGALTPADFGILRGRFFADVRHRRPGVIRILARHFQDADRLIRQYGLRHGLNTLDALQLSVALDFWHQGAVDVIVTADRVLLVVAGLERIPVFDPEAP